MTDMELVDTIESFQFCVSTLKYLIRQPTTPAEDKEIYAIKLTQLEKVFKRLVDTINIGAPANDEPL